MFADCSPQEQDQMLTDMQGGRFDLSPVPSAAFFSALLDATMEGFFADPICGGNRDMAGWKLVGFPGAFDSYTDLIEQWNYDWGRPPISIAQMPPEPMMHMPARGAQRRAEHCRRSLPRSSGAAGPAPS
jgi:gluconate 2-dehydrogenase gamma chain